jgi:hypothetical protein
MGRRQLGQSSALPHPAQNELPAGLLALQRLQAGGSACSDRSVRRGSALTPTRFPYLARRMSYQRLLPYNGRIDDNFPCL